MGRRNIQKNVPCYKLPGINIALNSNNKPKHLVVVTRHSPDLKFDVGDFSEVGFWLVFVNVGSVCDCSGGSIVP